MFSKRRVIVDAARFSSKWAPILLRFFTLFIGNQPAAEALTIDTLAEHIRAVGTTSGSEDTVRLLRRALLKAVATDATPSQLSDPFVRALSQLEPTKRAMLVLFRGLSLDLATVGQITRLEKVQVRRLCFDALKELRGLMDEDKTISPVRDGTRETQ